MLIWGTALLIAGLTFLLVEYYWRLIVPKAEEFDAAFLKWAIRGFVTPAVVWVVLNLDLVPGTIPLIPEAHSAFLPGGLGRFEAFKATCSGIATIATYWGALTLVNLWLQARQRAEVPEIYRFFSRTAVAVAVGLSALTLWLGGLPALGGAIGLGALVLLHVLSSFVAPVSLPNYSRAVAQTKFGKYGDAERAIIHELETNEKDYDGWMMLAELYALHFHELPEADRTIRDLVCQPGLSGFQISHALGRLAEWHLKSGDVAAARWAVQDISTLLPGTHFDRMAALRLQQIPISREEWQAQQRPRAIRMPALNDTLEDKTSGPAAQASAAEVKTELNRWLARLNANPDDIEAREQFAVLLTEQMGQVRLGMEQLNLLLEMPDKPADKIPAWLGLQAAWQLRHLENPAGARVTLQRLIREYPQSSQAFAAQRRLRLMEMEEQGRATAVVQATRPTLRVT